MGPNHYCYFLIGGAVLPGNTHQAFIGCVDTATNSNWKQVKHMILEGTLLVVDLYTGVTEVILYTYTLIRFILYSFIHVSIQCMCIKFDICPCQTLCSMDKKNT